MSACPVPGCTASTADLLCARHRAALGPAARAALERADKAVRSASRSGWSRAVRERAAAVSDAAASIARKESRA